jgi:hypothetical protein
MKQQQDIETLSMFQAETQRGGSPAWILLGKLTIHDCKTQACFKMLHRPSGVFF